MRNSLLDVIKQLDELTQELSEIKNTVCCVHNYFQDGGSYDNTEDALHDLKLCEKTLATVIEKIITE